MQHAFTTSLRQILFVAAVLAAFGLVGGRLVYLQVIAREDFQPHIVRARETVRTLPAKRGDITDRRGNLQATSLPFYEVGVDPSALTESDWSRVVEIARLLELDEALVREAFGRSHRNDGRAIRWVRLAEVVTRDVYRELASLTSRAVYGNLIHRRYYPGGQSGAHILGMMNKEGVAVAGIERTFDFYLRGVDGWLESERDSARREVAQFRSREIQPKNGYTVELTTDQYIQDLTDFEMSKLVEETKPDGVIILVSEVTTGALLASSVYPAFDPNHYWDFPVENHRNRALTDIFEPGSTFKIVAAAAALEEGLVHPGVVFDTSKEFDEYKGFRFRMPRDFRFYPQLTFAQVIEKSSNRGSAYLGMMLGEEKLYHYARAFGFGQRTGLHLTGEIPGILHRPANWDKLTISRLPMGHAVASTAMQVHMAMGALANGGVRMAPQVVHRILNESGEVVVRVEPVVVERVVSEKTALMMNDLLTQVVETGTARGARIDAYRAAGKTGTTDKIDPDTGRYLNNSNVASFSGFLPAERPQVVITIIVDNPRVYERRTGGLATGPAFKSLGRRIGQYLEWEPSPELLLPSLASHTQAGGPR